MKRAHFLYASVLALFFAASCQKDSSEPEIPKEKFLIPDVEYANIAGDNSCSSPYQIYLVRRLARPDGTWEWIWGIKNLKPGNGEAGTFTDLTSWAITLPECIKASNIKGAFGFVIHGPQQYHTPFTPEYKPNSSFLDCKTSMDITDGKPVLVFNYGTKGNVPTFFELILDKEYPIEQNGLSFYKSECGLYGTGVGSSCFPGIGCR